MVAQHAQEDPPIDSRRSNDLQTPSTLQQLLSLNKCFMDPQNSKTDTSRRRAHDAASSRILWQYPVINNLTYLARQDKKYNILQLIYLPNYRDSTTTPLCNQAVWRHHKAPVLPVCLKTHVSLLCDVECVEKHSPYLQHAEHTLPTSNCSPNEPSQLLEIISTNTQSNAKLMLALTLHIDAVV